MIDRDFGNWLAGFIDGEGCFFIAAVKRKGAGGREYYTYRPIFSLTVRDDDEDVVKLIHQVLGVGSLHYYQPSGTGKRVVRLAIQSHDGCATLREVLNNCPLRAKKKRDYEVWCKAVDVALTLKKGSGASCQPAWQELKMLKEELAEVRAYD